MCSERLLVSVCVTVLCQLELAVDVYHEHCNICISYYHRSNDHVCVHGREVNVKGGGGTVSVNTVHLTNDL